MDSSQIFDSDSFKSEGALCLYLGGKNVGLVRYIVNRENQNGRTFESRVRLRFYVNYILEVQSGKGRKRTKGKSRLETETVFKNLKQSQHSFSNPVCGPL